MGKSPRRRFSAPIWAVTLIGAGCLALSPVTRAGAAVAAPPGQGGSQGQGHSPQGQYPPPPGWQQQQQPPPQHQQQQQQPPPQHQQQPQPPSNGGRMGANDPHSWHNWDNNWRDDRFRREHSFDSHHERFEDRDHGRFEDRFHIDDFRGHFGDRDFRTDCDELHGIGSVRALLDFLDEHPAMRDFFEDHGDLFDFLVHHSDLGDDFDADCTFIDVF
jgi:hypothetical protein